MVRLYVGKKARSYDMNFDLMNIQTVNSVSMASEPRLARLLEQQPGVYFIALTFVDRKGRESIFSNEVRVETRPRTASVERFDPRGRESRRA